jgi:hypothetical protein
MLAEVSTSFEVFRVHKMTDLDIHSCTRLVSLRVVDHHRLQSVRQSGQTHRNQISISLCVEEKGASLP